jgi:hypothetical protein
MDRPEPGPGPEPGLVRCPTCRASQAWSETCRRCQSDLRLLREIARAAERHRAACLAHLRAGRVAAARRSARRFHALTASPESRRLLAVCALRDRDWAAAAPLARRLLDAD